MKLFYLTLCLVFITNITNAQSKTFTDKEFARNPVWINMIKDTTANYFVAERAFKIYFENHDKPGGENDEIGERAKSEKYPSKKEKRKLQQENNMRLEIKKYERWHDRMFPYVKADGSILTPSQRLQIWKDNKATK